MGCSAKYIGLALSSLLVIGMAGSAMAGDLFDPYASANRNPFVQIYGLPAVQGADLPGRGQWRSALQLEASSHFSRDSIAGEQVVIDGESHRSNLQFRYGYSNSIEFGIDIPYLNHEGGGLDRFIDDWHDFWGLPDGDRPEFARDQLQFSYRDLSAAASADNSVDMLQPGHGLGDVSLSIAYQLAATDSRQWALRSALKLPTGESRRLRGSGSTDLSLGLHVSDQGLMRQYALQWHGSLGVLWMDGGEVLPSLRRDWVGYGSSTVSWQVSPEVSLKLQLDAHSAFYRSDLDQLGKVSAQIIIGAGLRLNRQWQLDFGVSEDIVVDTAPDVVFHLAIKRRGLF